MIVNVYNGPISLYTLAGYITLVPILFLIRTLAIKYSPDKAK